MRCSTARALLPLFEDEALSLDEHQEVAEHLRQCSACAAVRAEIEAPLPPLPRLPPNIMAHFGRELDDALEEEIALIDLAKRRQRWQPSEPACTRRPLFYGALLGASATLTLVGLVLLSGSSRPGALPPESETTAYAASQSFENPRADEWSNAPLAEDIARCLASIEQTSEPIEASLQRICGSFEGQNTGPGLIRTASTLQP